MTTDWAPEPKAIAEELDPDYNANPYTDPWNSVMQRLAEADPDLLKKLANWGLGETGT